MLYLLLIIITILVLWAIEKYTSSMKSKTRVHRRLLFWTLCLLIFFDDGATLFSYNAACMLAGVHINKKITADGFYAPTAEKSAADIYLREGYSYVETGGLVSPLIRHTHQGSMAIEETISKYKINSVNTRTGYKIKVYKATITSIAAGEVLGYESIASTRGGFLLRAIKRIFFLDNTDISCTGSTVAAGASGDLITAVIPPKK